MTLVMSALVSRAKVAAVTLLAASLWVCCTYLLDRPFSNDASNTAVVVMYGLLAWGALLAVAQARHAQGATGGDAKWKRILRGTD